MSVQTFSVAGDSSTDASFRAWGSALSAALDAAGFPKTADTGQVNWATVTHPVSSNTTTGYEVRRFNDALQATAPVFFKIEYGMYTTSAAPSLWFTIGTGSDGAGTITAPVPAGISNVPTARTQLAPSATATPAVTSYLSVDETGSALMMALWPNASAAQLGMVALLERSRDWTGAPTGDGLTHLQMSPTLNPRVFPLTFLPGVATNSNAIAQYLNPFGTTSQNTKTCVIGNVVYPVPVPLNLGPRSVGYSKMLMLVCAGDLPQSSTVPLTVYGSAQTWFAFGLGFSPNYGGGGMSSVLARIS